MYACTYVHMPTLAHEVSEIPAASVHISRSTPMRRSEAVAKEVAGSLWSESAESTCHPGIFSLDVHALSLVFEQVSLLKRCEDLPRVCKRFRAVLRDSGVHIHLRLYAYLLKSLSAIV